LLKKEVPSTVLKELFGKFPKNHQLIFLWGEFFVKKRSPKHRAQGNSLENFPKITIFCERNMKSLRILEDLGRFLAFFF
jgi:hypothetical protein